MTNINWKQDQPIIKHLRQWVPTVFPIVEKNKPECRGIGGYADRKTAMGTESAHAEGRAADIFLNVSDQTQKKIGDELFEMFRKSWRKLGTHHVIWNKKMWDTHNGLRDYTGTSPHTDHVHVDFKPEYCQNQPPVLMTLLEDVKNKVSGTEGGTAS